MTGACGKLEGEWPERGPHPFGDREWFTAWWDAFGEGEPCVARAAGAVLPLQRRRCRPQSMSNYHSPVVETTGDLDEHAKGLGSALERGFAIEASGWKARAGTAIVSRPETKAFYTALANAYRDAGELVLGTLAVDGRDIAWHFTLRRGPRLYVLNTGYLEDQGKLAPGLVLHLLTIEHCFADPSIEAYELLGDTERWRLEFATTERTHVRAWAFTRGPVGSAGWGVRRHGVPLARRIRDRRARSKT